MESLATFLDRYGWLTMLGLLALTNAGKIAAWVERVAGYLWPAWAETRRQRQEREREREEHATFSTLGVGSLAVTPPSSLLSPKIMTFSILGVGSLAVTKSAARPV